MMIHAYNEIYVNDAMQTLAELFSYVNNENEADELFHYFINSKVSIHFSKGNPKYINMPSQALFKEIVKDNMELTISDSFSRSPLYWCGFVLAFYQWHSNLSFKEIASKLLPSKIISMYNPLHEASIFKFVDVANDIMFANSCETNLSLKRKNSSLSQSQLAKLSGVSLRAIQLYEQRKLDINMANAIKLYKLSKVLNCKIEDLLENRN